MKTFEIQRRQETLTDYLIEANSNEDAQQRFEELTPEEVADLPANVVFSYDGVDEVKLLVELGDANATTK